MGVEIETIDDKIDVDRAHRNVTLLYNAMSELEEAGQECTYSQQNEYLPTHTFPELMDDILGPMTVCDFLQFPLQDELEVLCITLVEELYELVDIFSPDQLPFACERLSHLKVLLENKISL